MYIHEEPERASISPVVQEGLRMTSGVFPISRCIQVREAMISHITMEETNYNTLQFYEHSVGRNDIPGREI